MKLFTAHITKASVKKELSIRAPTVVAVKALVAQLHPGWTVVRVTKASS